MICQFKNVVPLTLTPSGLIGIKETKCDKILRKCHKNGAIKLLS